MTLDHRIRVAGVAFLERQTELHEEVLAYDILSCGFTFDGQRVPLLGPQGIFKPKVLPEMPIADLAAWDRRG